MKSSRTHRAPTALPLVCFAVAALLAFAGPASAQEALAHHTGSADLTSTHTALIQGPWTATLVFAVSDTRTGLEPAPAAMIQPSRNNTALMIVGGAGILLGAVIGGDEGTVIMIAGGGVGLLGLYRHLR